MSKERRILEVRIMKEGPRKSDILDVRTMDTTKLIVQKNQSVTSVKNLGIWHLSVKV